MFYIALLLINLFTAFSPVKKVNTEPAGFTIKKAAILNNSIISNLQPKKKPRSIYRFSAPITLEGKKNITIRGDSILAGSNPAISLVNCSNIHITRSRLLKGTGVKAIGILLKECTNITIDSCYISNVASGIYALRCTGVVINGNQMQNMLGPYPRGQFVQFDDVRGAGNKVTNNRLQNIDGESYAEDAISMYKTNGTAASPVVISGNWIKGGGPSKTGGGVMLGDGGGSYQIAENNKLVNPGQYGMAVSGGTNMQISNNRVYSAKTSVSNVGIYINNQYPVSCNVIVVNGNHVNWTNSKGNANGSWNSGNCGKVPGWAGNNWNDLAVTKTLLQKTLIVNK